MGGSMGKSDSDSVSSSGFEQKVFPQQSAALRRLYNQATDLFNSTNSQMRSLTPGAEQYAQGVANTAQPAWENQLAGGAYQDMNLQNNLMSSLNKSLNSPTATSEINAMIMGGDGNNYADAMKQTYLDDAAKQQANMMNTMDQRAALNGQSGSSRHGIAQALGMEDINKNTMDNLANVGYNTFDKDLNRKLDIAQMADQGTLARQQMMSNMIGNQNNAMAGGLNYSPTLQNLGMGQFAPSMMPWQAMGNYANVLGQPTVLGSGSMMGTSNSDSKSLGGFF